MDVLHHLEAVGHRDGGFRHRYRAAIRQHGLHARMLHATEDLARHVERVTKSRTLGDSDGEAAVTGADLEEYRVRFYEWCEQRNAIRHSGSLLGLGNLAGELGMRGDTAEQFVVNGAIQAESFGAWRRAQAFGQLDFHSIVKFDVRVRTRLASRSAPRIRRDAGDFHVTNPLVAPGSSSRSPVLRRSNQRRRPVTRLMRRPKIPGRKPSTCIEARGLTDWRRISANTSGGRVIRNSPLEAVSLRIFGRLRSCWTGLGAVSPASGRNAYAVCLTIRRPWCAGNHTVSNVAKRALHYARV